MPTRNIQTFLVYAEEDYRFRDQVISQAKNSKIPVDFVEMPTKQPWVERWKGICRTRAVECDGAIVLITKKTSQAAGVQWELECVSNAGIPILCVLADQCDKSAVPEEISDAPVINWNWPEIATFIQSLRRPEAVGR